MHIDKKRFYDLIATKTAAHIQSGAKRSSLCSSRLFAEDSYSEHNE